MADEPLSKTAVHDQLDTELSLQTICRRIDRLADADYLDERTVFTASGPQTVYHLTDHAQDLISRLQRYKVASRSKWQTRHLLCPVEPPKGRTLCGRITVSTTMSGELNGNAVYPFRGLNRASNPDVWCDHCRAAYLRREGLELETQC